MANDQQMRLKNEKHASSSLDKSKRTKKQQKMQMGPIVLAIFLFVVVGSALFQIFNAAGGQSGDIMI